VASAPEPSPGAAVAPRAPSPPTVSSPPLSPAKPAPPPPAEARRSDSYYQVKATIFGALIEAIDLAQLAKLDGESAREEIRDIVNEIIAIKNIVMSIAEQEELLDDICNDVLGYGPLEPLLARDDIADIMVNGAGVSSARSAGASTNLRRSATPVSPTARASTPSSRRCHLMAPRSPSANSKRTS
jgi:pilus assembly protein CpaF